MPFDGFPLVIGLEMTLACNLRCRHCASSAGQPRENELSTEELLAICDQFPPLLVQEVDMTGGEPLLRSDWQKIASHLRDLNIPVRMVTNGILLKENIGRLIDAGVQTVGISIDGFEESHDQIRDHPGLFKTIISNVESALSAGLPVAVITSVTSKNSTELSNLSEFLFSLGIRHWQVQPLFPLGRAADHGLNISTNTFLELGLFIKNHASCSSMADLQMPVADGVGYYTDLDVRTRPWKGCGAGRASCGITASGKVKGCLSLPDQFIEGDLRTHDLWEIWFAENSFTYNRHFSLGDLGVNCAGCEKGSECMGGCTVMSYAATNKIHNDPFCFYSLSKGTISK
jgi:radical SAM protein with 4Fe4S-binding SPASM domain